MGCSPRSLRNLAAVCAIALLPAVAVGQTRADQHRQEQTAKAMVVQPPHPNPAERAVDLLKRYGILGEPVAGVRPVVTTLYPGGWVAFGGAYRHPFRDTGSVDLQAAWSIKNYRGIDGIVHLPTLARGRVSVDVTTSWLDAPTVAFYGVGNDSRSEDRTTFGYRPTTVGLVGAIRPRPNVRLGAGVDYLTIDTTADVPSTSNDAPSIWPALADSDPRYVRTHAFLELDRRSRPGYSGSGGDYRLELQQYTDRSGSSAGFRSMEVEAVQLVPILRANWVIALRGLATITDRSGDSDVPYFVMPSIGGNSSVRGYPSFRFRDNHRLLMSAEYRWTPARFVDMAIFYDAGKVSDRAKDLNLTGLQTSYGIGARFHGNARTGFRLELARNDEGSFRLVWSTQTAF